MANILLYDLTDKKDYAGIFRRAARELSKYRKTTICSDAKNNKMMPRCQDMLRQAYDSQRKKLRADIFLEAFTQKLLQHPENPANYERVFLLDNDLCTKSTNWIFGLCQQRQGGIKYLISSTARIVSNAHAYDHLAHEMGHMYGAPSRGRFNTVEHLGLHCTSAFCVMQQRDTVRAAKVFVEERLQAAAPTYCKLCQGDLLLAAVKERRSDDNQEFEIKPS